MYLNCLCNIYTMYAYIHMHCTLCLLCLRYRPYQVIILCTDHWISRIRHRRRKRFASPPARSVMARRHASRKWSPPAGKVTAARLRGLAYEIGRLPIWVRQRSLMYWAVSADHSTDLIWLTATPRTYVRGIRRTQTGDCRLTLLQANIHVCYPFNEVVFAWCKDKIIS